MDDANKAERLLRNMVRPFGLEAPAPEGVLRTQPIFIDWPRGPVLPFCNLMLNFDTLPRQSLAYVSGAHNERHPVAYLPTNAAVA